MERVTVNTKKNIQEIGGAESDASFSLPKPVSSKSGSTIDKRNINQIPQLKRGGSLSYLGSSMVDLFRLPSGSLRASVFTIISGCVGGGTLTLSYGIYMAGTIPSLFYLIMATLFQAYTAYVLVYCSDINECKTFRKLSRLLYNKSFATFIQCNELLLLWCIAVSYMTFSKNLLGPAVQHLIGHNQWYDNGIVLLSILLFFIITPLALKRKIAALRYSSLFGFCAVAFTVIVVIILYFEWCNDDTKHDGADNPDRYCLFSQFSKTMSSTKLFKYSFLDQTYTIAVMAGGYCVQPTILPIYYGINPIDRSPNTMLKGLWYSFVVVFILYICVAYCGYFSFPDTVSQNLLTSNYGDNTLVLIAQIALSVYVVMVIPLFAHAFRSSMKGLILSRQQSNVALLTENNHNNNNNTNELSLNKHILVTLLYLYTAYAVAIVADNIGTVNSLISSTTMPVISFFFPAAVVWKTKQASRTMVWITIMICVTMTANSILQIIRQIIAWAE